MAQLAELCVEAGKSNAPPIRPVNRSQLERLPLSFAQERLWFLDQLEPGNAAYNVPAAFTISGELDIDQLERAFNLIIARHENLRALFPSQEGQAHQLILNRLDFSLERIGLGQYESKEARDLKAKEICRSEAVTPFDLARGPLLRGKVIKLSQHEHLLMLNTHQIISDDWSLGVMIKEVGMALEAFGQGRDPELPALPIQYVDYSVWQRKWLEEEGTLKEQLAYWQKKLADLPPLELPSDYPRSAQPSHPSGVVPFQVSAEVTEQLRNFSRQEGVSLFMTLVAAFQLLLSRYSGQEDIAVGTSIANRNRLETEGMIGFFVNQLVLRTQVDGEQNFRELVRQVRETTLSAYACQEVPFGKLVEELAPQRDLSRSPLFQVGLTFQNLDSELSKLRAMHMEFFGPPLRGKFDLALILSEGASGVQGKAYFATELFESKTIERLLGHYQQMLVAAVQDPERRVGELNWQSAEERQQLIQDWNDTQREYESHLCVHEIFSAQAAAAPDRTAIAWEDVLLSYGELEKCSNQLGRYLRGLGVGAEVRVGVCLKPGIGMIIALLSVLKAGGAYLPLDPRYPAERLAYMVEDGEIALLLSEVELDRAVPGSPVIKINLKEHAEEIAKCSSSALERVAGPEHLAYVMYTSGSTGKPKGVAVTHGNIVRLVRGTNYVTVGPDDVFLQFAPFCFDASTFEIWGSLLNGARLAIFPIGMPSLDELGAEVERQQVSTLWLTASLFHQMIDDHGQTLRNVRQLLAGGEVLSPDHVRRAAAILRGGKVINGYGPTENTTFTCCYAVSGEARFGHSVPIGKAIANTSLYVLDRYGEPVPVGAAGELYTGGAGVARGYLNQPGLTAERFVPDGFAEKVGGRLYRSGDRVRRRGDGVLEFLGRLDEQVKIRGYRVEPREIEAVIHEHAGVRQALVVTREEAGGEKRLVAYVVGEGSTGSELQRYLEEKLPHYMVPEGFVLLEKLPLTANGKVDRQALERMEVRIGSEKEYVGPKDERERQLLEIWGEVLKMEPEKIGVNDNFFELGGHSHLAAQLVAKIRSRLDIDLPLKALFEQPSVGQIARFIAGAGKSNIPSIRSEECSARVEKWVPQPEDHQRPEVVAHWIAQLVAEILGRPKVGVDDSISDLGMNSLQIARLTGRIRVGLGAVLTFRHVLEMQTPAQLAEFVSQAPTVNVPRLRPRPDVSRIPLTSFQFPYWVGYQMDPDSRLTDNRLFIQCSGPLDHAALQRAFNQVFWRHDILRTTFPEDQSGPHQVRARRGQGKFPLSVVDLCGAAQASHADIFTAITRAASLPLDLLAGPVIRATLLRLSELDHLLLIITHFIIADGLSLEVMFRDLAASYRSSAAGEPPSLPVLPVQYSDFALWEAERLTPDKRRQQESFWKRQLASPLPALLFPTTNKRPAVAVWKSHARLTLAECTLLKNFAAQEQCSTVMVLLAGVKLLLAQKSEQTDVLVGVVTGHRSDPLLHDLIGPFDDVLPVRTSLGGTTSFRSILSRARQSLLNAFDHSDLRLNELLRLVGSRPRSGPTQLCEVLLNVLEAIPDQRIGDLWMRARTSLHECGIAEPDGREQARKMEAPSGVNSGSSESQPAPFALYFTGTLDGSGLALELQGNARLFAESMVSDLLQRFVQILMTGLMKPDEAA